MGAADREEDGVGETPVVELLRGCPIFEGLSDKELDAVRRIGKEVSFPAGREIVKQGATGVGFHLIMEGQAAVEKDGQNIADLGPGKYFGEMSLIDGGPRSATVRAESDVRTFSLASWSFSALLDDNPSIARTMLVELSKRIRNAERSETH
jgi:CRP-like cAMP-binding protein